MCIKDPINKTCWKNGKDLSKAAPKIKLWNHTKKTHFPVFAKNFRRPCMKLKIFFCQFPNPWTLRVSGMGGYTSKCEKKSKSLHPIVQQNSGRLMTVPCNRVKNSSFFIIVSKIKKSLIPVSLWRYIITHKVLSREKAPTLLGNIITMYHKQTVSSWWIVKKCYDNI